MLTVLGLQRCLLFFGRSWEGETVVGGVWDGGVRLVDMLLQSEGCEGVASSIREGQVIVLSLRPLSCFNRCMVALYRHRNRWVNLRYNRSCGLRTHVMSSALSPSARSAALIARRSVAVAYGRHYSWLIVRVLSGDWCLRSIAQSTAPIEATCADFSTRHKTVVALLDEWLSHHLTMVQLLGLSPIVTHIHVLARFGQAGFTSIPAAIGCQIVLARMAGVSHAWVPRAELVHYLASSLLLGDGLAYLDCLLCGCAFLTNRFDDRWSLGRSEARRIRVQACESIPCIVLFDR